MCGSFSGPFNFRFFFACIQRRVRANPRNRPFRYSNDDDCDKRMVVNDKSKLTSKRCTNWPDRNT